MSLHVFANIVTPYGTAANNRGETEGNVTTLQKLIWMGLPHTSISAEAIRFALRRLLASQEEKGTNRTYNEDTRVNEWKERDFASWNSDGTTGYIDDDLLGYMSAEAAKDNAGDEVPETEAAPEAEQAGKRGKPKAKPKAKGTATVRRGVLEITRRSIAYTLARRHDLQRRLPSGHEVSRQRGRRQPCPLRHRGTCDALPVWSCPHAGAAARQLAGRKSAARPRRPEHRCRQP